MVGPLLTQASPLTTKVCSLPCSSSNPSENQTYKRGREKHPQFLPWTMPFYAPCGVSFPHRIIRESRSRRFWISCAALRWRRFLRRLSMLSVYIGIGIRILKFCLWGKVHETKSNRGREGRDDGPLLDAVKFPDNMIRTGPVQLVC